MNRLSLALPCRVYHFACLDSTNQKLKDWMPPEDTAIYADYQTAGRGQGNHIWHCREKQGLLMSLLYYPKSEITADQLLQLSVSAVCSSIRNLADGTVSVAIKSPNDILSGGRKLGGILLENTFQGDRLTASIIGIGINLYQEHFPGSDYARTPISLRQLGISVTIEELLYRILKEIYRMVQQNPEQIKETYLNYLLAADERIHTQSNHQKKSPFPE